MKDSTMKNTQMKPDKNRGKMADLLKEGRFLPNRDQFLERGEESKLDGF